MTVTLSNRDFVTHGDASGSRPLSSDGCPVTFRDRGRLQGDPPQQTVATGGHPAPPKWDNWDIQTGNWDDVGQRSVTRPEVHQVTSSHHHGSVTGSEAKHDNATEHGR